MSSSNPAAGADEPAAQAHRAAVRAQHSGDLAAENERLRARLAALEIELVEIESRTDAIVARAQDRTYWLERWQLDLNELMRRPGAAQLRKAFRGLRWFARKWRNHKRRWRSR